MENGEWNVEIMEFVIFEFAESSNFFCDLLTVYIVEDYDWMIGMEGMI